jgi:integrase
MDTTKGKESAPAKERQSHKLTANGPESSETARRKSATQVPRKKAGGVGKNSANYWQGRIFKPVNSAGVASPHYMMRVKFKGRRVAFGLGTAKQSTAASLAADIYRDLLTLGIDGTLAKHRPEAEKPVRSANLGEWITGALKVSEASTTTLADYSRALRKIVGDMLAVKRSKKRFGPKRGGAASYRAEIDGASLDILTPAAIQQWRLGYIAKAKTPAEERSRKTTCNSCIRKSASLFAPKIVKYLPALRLPSPAPFADAEFFPRQSAKYFSRIDAKALLQKANSDLTEKDTPAFLTMLLVLSAGLRRQEVDSLCWHQVDFDRQLIRIEATDKASLKTTDSRGEVAIDPSITAILRGFFAKVKDSSAYVVEGSGAAYGPQVWGRHYRADDAFNRLIAWLRANGVTARKPIHELRKELGALVTAEHGIYAASRVLRHSNVATTAAHYTDLKTRPVVNVGAWLTPSNVVEIPAKPTQQRRRKRSAPPESALN